ncbi:hypothetical protein GF374_01040 [Candidatus Woesearchaeota archaeon]|nr:hypothetical protein [Candidatus Woesearchaeota archaeon]
MEEQKSIKKPSEEEFEKVTSESWIPKEKGDFIIGSLIDVKHDVGKFKQNVYSIDNGKEIIDFFGSTVLDRKMKTITIGERIKIEFLGMNTTEDGKTEYKDFELYRSKR